MYATERASRRVPSVKRGQRSVRLNDTTHNTSRASAGVVDMPSGVQSLNFSSSLDSTNAWEDVAAAAAHSRQASTVGAAPTTPRTPRTPRRRTPSRGGGGGGGGGGVSRPHVAIARDDALDVLDRATRGREGRTDCWSHLYSAAQKAQQQREVANMQGRFVLEELDRQMTFTPNAQRRRGRSGSAGRSSRRTPGATTMMSSVNVWDKLAAAPPATTPPPAHPEELECRFTPKISEYARAKLSKQSVLQRLVPDPEVQHADRFEEPSRHGSRREKSLHDVSVVHEKLFTRGDRHGQVSEREARRKAQEDKSMGPRVHLSHAQQEHVFQRLFDSSLPGGGAVDRDSPLAGIAERHQQQRTPARAAVLAVSPTSRRPAVDFNDALLLPLSLRDDADDDAAAAAALAEPPNKAAPHGAFTPLSVPSSLALASPAPPAPAGPVNVKQVHQPPPPVGGKGAGGPPTPSLSPLREPSTPPPVPPAATRQASKPGMKKAPSAHNTPCVTPRGAPGVKDPPSRGNSFSGLGGDVSGMSSLRLQQSVVAAATAGGGGGGGNAPIPFSPDDSDEFHSEEEDEADVAAAAPLLYRQVSTAFSHASSAAPVAAAEAASAATLRFRVGDAVLCSTAEGRVLGHVVKLWEGPNAYRVATEAGELHARNDTDAFVKSAGQRVSVEKRNGVVGIVYAGLSVADVGPGTAADGRIARGSTLVAIDGTVVTTHDEVSAALASAPATQPFDVYLHPPPLGREPAPQRTSKTPVMPPGTPRMMKGPSSTPPGSRGSSPHGGPAFAKSPAAKGTLKGPAPKGSVKGPAGGGGAVVHATSTLPQNAGTQRPPPLATGKLPVHHASAANRPGSPTTPRRSPSPERGPSGGGGGGKKKVPRPRLKNK